MRRALAGRSPTVWLSCAIASDIAQFYTGQAVLHLAWTATPWALSINDNTRRISWPTLAGVPTMRAPVPFIPPSLPVVASALIRDDVALGDIATADWNALAGSQPFLS